MVADFFSNYYLDGALFRIIDFSVACGAFPTSVLTVIGVARCPGAAELIRKYCQQCMFCMMVNKTTAVPVPYVRPSFVLGFLRYCLK